MHMAIIQMINNEVHNVSIDSGELNNLLGRGRPSPMIELDLVGAGKIWINAAQISCFVD
jgi:hypothetical protein